MSPGHFLIGGAQRSGTTLLYHLLDQHPQIAMARPLRPEPKFFLRDDAATATLDDYRRELFPGATNVRMLGEKSTAYIERPDIAQRVLRILPDVKLVFVLRDPVERALSNYRFSVENGVETEPIERAFAQEETRTYNSALFSVSPFAYQKRGHYWQYLDPWQRTIGRDKMFLLPFEQLTRQPEPPPRQPEPPPRQPESPPRHPESAKRDEGSPDAKLSAISRSFAVSAAQDDGGAAQDDGGAARVDGGAAWDDGGRDTLRALHAWLGVDPSFEPTRPAQPVNATAPAEDVDTTFRRRLIDQFRESNRILAERYGVDVSLWQS